MKEYLLKIFKHFGVKNQIKKLNEECYELCEAVLLQDSKEHIEEEMADVLIILGQIVAFYNLDHSKINTNVDYKIDRTLSRINIGYYKKERMENESNRSN